MNGTEICAKVKEIIVRVLNLEIEPHELVENGLIETYGINSVDALEILINVENEFETQIDEDDLNAELINTVSTLSEYIEARIKALN